MTHPSRSTRREFLQGKSAADSIADLLDRGGPEAAQPAAASESYLLQFGRRAMACQFEAFFNAGQYAAAADAAMAAFDLIDCLEAQMTVFRDESEIARINRSAAELAVEVEPRLFDLLCRAAELHRQTDGALDITAGPLTKVWGFYRRQGAIPGAAELAEARDRVGSQWLELDEAARTIQFRKSGMELNLGAIGKGYALDRAAEELLAAGIDSFLLHGGSSSVLARGSCGLAGGDGWKVDLRHPLHPERSLAEIRLRDRALGTSGAGTQFFRHQGRRYGHILDPRTGWPAEGVYSTTVITSRAADADALATALYVLGPERAATWCRQHPEVGLLMVLPGEGGKRVEVLVEGIAEGDYRLTGTQPPFFRGTQNELARADSHSLRQDVTPGKDPEPNQHG
ncbi:MAG TPA: FAD:protein FMN transferase [Pirellulales bacterium]|nr:FAD:protein FMN transferase [Pirellulales bacterium]